MKKIINKNRRKGSIKNYKNQPAKKKKINPEKYAQKKEKN